MTDTDLQHLRAAFELAREARQHGDHPFGALLAGADGTVLLGAENSVFSSHDSTAHAETNLVRLASVRFSREELAGCTLYASTEPCAMCAGAIFWAGIGRVVFGLAAERLLGLVGPSSEELRLSCRELLARGGRPTVVEGPLLEDEALAVHAGFWETAA